MERKGINHIGRIAVTVLIVAATFGIAMAGGLVKWQGIADLFKGDSPEKTAKVEATAKPSHNANYAHTTAFSGMPFALSVEGCSVTGEAGSMDGTSEIEIMAIDSLPPLAAGMVNVTRGHAGYRLSPAGLRFARPVSVELGYDSLLLPKGHSSKEIRTFLYNSESHHWEALPRDSVMEGSQNIVSQSKQAGEMINAIVQLPELPESKAFTPTMLTELEAAHPATGITMMESPAANSSGTANLSYPITVPAGRNGLQPNLSVSYSSEAGNGLLGMGWDMQLPAITVDSKWGVPRYDAADETECYSYNGQELLPSPHYLTQWESRNTSGNKQFRPRTEGSFDSIVRCGNGPTEYYWIVWDKGGTKYYYGTYDGSTVATSVLLMDGAGNIGHWPLCRVEDLDGNFMTYHYTVREQYDAGNNYLGQQLWPDSIVYTGYGTDKGRYKMVFVSGPPPTPALPQTRFMPPSDPGNECDCDGYPFDYRNNARSGFLRNERDKLLRVEIYCGSAAVRSYSFCYGSDIFGRAQLRRIRQWGADPQDGYHEHSLEYYRETSADALLGIGSTSVSNIDSLYDSKAVRFLNKLATPFSAVAAQLWGTRTLLSGSRDLGYGVSGGADVGIGTNRSSKDNAVSYGISYTHNSGRGLNTLMDVTGDGLPDRIYRKGGDLYCQPQVNGTFGSPKQLKGDADFLRSEARTISHGPSATIGVSQVAAVHGGLHFNRTHSFTDTYLSDLNGDGLLDLVCDGDAVTIMPSSGPPAVSWPESCGIPAVTADTMKRYPAISLDHLPEPAVPDLETDVPYYDIVRVWRNGGLNDLTPDIYAKAWLSDSVVEYGHTLKDSVVVSVEFYGYFTNDQSHALHHLLLACDTLGVGDTAWKGNLLAIQPDGGYLLHAEAMASPYIHNAAYNTISMSIDSGSCLFFRARSLHGRAVSHLLEWNPSVVPHNVPATNACIATHYKDAGVCSFPRSDGMFHCPYTGNATLTVPSVSGSATSTLKCYRNGTLLHTYQSGAQNINYALRLHQGDSLRFEASGDTCLEWHGHLWHPKIVYSGINFANAFYPVPHYSCWYPTSNRSLKERSYVPFGNFYGGWGQFQYRWDGAAKMSLKKMFRLRDSLQYFSLNTFQRLTDTAFLRGLADAPSPNLTDTLEWWLACLPMQPDGERSRYNGFFPNAFIDSGRISLGCVPGALELEVQAGTSGNGGGTQQGSAAPRGSSRMGNVEDIPFSATDKVSLTKSWSVTFSGSSIAQQQTNFSAGGTLSFGHTCMEQDLLDMNGDGVADVIQDSNIFYSRPFPASMDAARRPMEGFSTHSSTNITNNTDAMARAKDPVQITVRSGKGQFSVRESGGGNAGTSTDCTEHTLADINGDGLPDMVYRNGTVRLNTGYGFGQGRTWNNLDEVGTAVSTSAGAGGSFSVWSDAVSAGLGATRADNVSPVFLCDINGDGMPDIVYLLPTGAVLYRPNTGSGFGDLTTWRVVFANGSLETGVSSTISGDAGITGGFTLFGLKCGVSAGLHGSVGMNNERMQIIDFNGDGMPDFLTSLSKGKLHVCYADSGRTGLLKTVTNPLGGSITMDYGMTSANVYHSRRWVMTKVVVHDSLPGDGCDSLRTRIRYDHGYYDRTEREFLGFAVVESEPLDENGSALRSVIRYYDNRSVHTKGSLLCEAVVRKQVQDTVKYMITTCSYDTAHVGSPLGGIRPVFPRLTRRQTCFYDQDGHPKITAWEVFDYENTHGNVTRHQQGSTDQETVEANISYHAQYNNNHCVNRVSSVEIPGFKKRTTEVDNKGHYTVFRDFYDNTNSLTTRLQYDYYGNVTTMRGPNTTVHYTYDNFVHSYPTAITDTFGVTSQMQDYDFRFGVPLTMVDQAGSQMLYTIDGWGRIITIRGPKEIAAGKPFTIRHTYTGREPAPSGSTRQRAVSMAITEHYDPQHPNNTIKTYTYCDGLGRIVQTRKEAEIGGMEKLVVSGRTGYDAFGRAVWSYFPEEIHVDSTRFRFLPVSGQPETVHYDALDRPVMRVARDASVTVTSYGFNDAHLDKTLFSTTTIDANSHVSTELTDVSGKPWVIHPAGQQPVYFDYNSVGDNTKVYSSLPNDWERLYTYDRLGRRESYAEGNLHETYIYDGGNLAELVQEWFENGQPQTKTTRYHYNAHRLDSVSYEDALTTIYHYDQYGRVDSLYDESGVMCYEYGDMGEVTQETRIYALPFLTNPLALSTQFTYDSWGRIQDITYPDNEVVSYGYDLGGQLQSISNNSSYTYLDNVTYDRFGAKEHQEYGNGMVTDYEYNIVRRLSRIDVTSPANGVYSDINYTYDPVGNVTQVASNYSWLNNQSLTETFTYDASDQLVSASETQFQSYLLDVTYGNWGSISDYSLVQTNMLDNSTTSDAHTFCYPTDLSVQPQCQTLFAPEMSNGTSDVTYSFGINGSMRKREVQSPNSYTEHYLFNSAANLKAYGSDAADFAYYGYNASNARAYKMSLSGTYQWQNGQQLQMNLQPQLTQFYPNAYINFNGNGEYTKHYYCGSERIASRLGNANTDITVTANARLANRATQLASRFQDDIRELMSDNSTVCPPNGISVNSLHQTGTSDIFYYHTNHLGSTAFVTDQNQNITQGFLYAPFGEITTEYAPMWQNGTLPKYSFNAKELDEETGMYYYEARYYKPPVFTSRDPMMDQKPWLTPYHYCSNNPVGRVDPTGMFDTTNIKMNTHYKTILVLQSNYDEYDHNGAIAKDERIALKKGMPILYVDDIEDFAAAMEAFAEWGSSTDSYVISSHGSCNSFNIGSTDVDHSTDMTVLLKGLNNKTVFISACNVASCNIGKTLLQNFSKQTSSTVIGATEKIKGGYRYHGGMGLNWYGNVFYMSSKGSDAVEIYNLRIHQKKGMKYRTHLLSISIFRHENYDN